MQLLITSFQRLTSSMRIGVVCICLAQTSSIMGTHLQTSNTSPIPSSQPITLNVTVHGQKVTQVSNHASEQQQSARQEQRTSTGNADILAALQKKLKELLRTYPHQWYITISQHPYKTLALCGIACYCGIIILNGQDHWYFDDKNRWTSWRHEVPLEELCTRNQQHLLEELREAIYYRYIPMDPQLQSNTPHNLFLHDITEEINRAERYLARIKRLQYWWLDCLFALHVESIAKKLARGQFLKRLFIQWLMQQRTTA